MRTKHTQFSGSQLTRGVLLGMLVTLLALKVYDFGYDYAQQRLKQPAPTAAPRPR